MTSERTEELTEWESESGKKFKEELNACLAVRCPQEKLDLRLLGPEVREAHRPELHYGLLCRREDRIACIERNKIKVPDCDKPGFKHSDLMATFTLGGYLASKYGIPINMILPLTKEEDLYIVSLDDTLEMRQSHPRYGHMWRKKISPVVDKIREDLGLGDQPAKWYWIPDFGVGYRCPLPEYNPPEMNRPVRRRRGELYSDEESSDFESDSGSNSEIDSDDEEEKEKEDAQDSEVRL